MFKKSWPNLFCNFSDKMVQDFLDRQYRDGLRKTNEVAPTDYLPKYQNRTLSRITFIY